jgi:hypothetical protein
MDIGKWLLENQVIVGIAVSMLLGVAGLLNLKKIIRGAGMAFSKITRKYLGEKAEKESETLAEEFIEGMKSDNVKK